MPLPRKAQTAMEYLLIVGIALALVTPIWIYVTSFEGRSAEQLSLSYAQVAVDRLADSADLVYSQGPPARLRLKVHVPSGIEEVNITQRTAIFRMSFGSGTTDVYAVSQSDLQGSLPAREGNYWVDVEAFDGYVNISLAG
jgi:uncharacterized protein (UPF0333 family)